MVDKEYCMSSFLMFRCIANNKFEFKQGINHRYYTPNNNIYKIKNSTDIENAIKDNLKNTTSTNIALMLSGGIDSAILAKYIPKGTKAYTLKCIADGGCIDETERAKLIADRCNLDHEIIEIYWDDYLEFSKMLMINKGAPIHSIEPQIYKAALKAKNNGIKKLLFGESADCIFGGQDKLFSKEWTIEEFVHRYSYIIPNKVLKNGRLIMEPYLEYSENNIINICDFMKEFYYKESLGSYLNACDLAGIEYLSPYSNMRMNIPLDLSRIKAGESKYLIRELYAKLYPDVDLPQKTPMPRAVKQWLKDWKGPTRGEFLPDCIDGLNGDQKWLVYCLEQFLNLLDEM